MTLGFRAIIVAAISVGLLAFAGCNTDQGCRQGRQLRDNLETVSTQLSVADENPVDFHARLCPWLIRVETPYLSAISLRYERLAHYFDTPMSAFFPGTWREQMPMQYSATELSRELHRLTEDFARACSGIAARDLEADLQTIQVRIHTEIEHTGADLMESAHCWK